MLSTWPLAPCQHCSYKFETGHCNCQFFLSELMTYSLPFCRILFVPLFTVVQVSAIDLCHIHVSCLSCVIIRVRDWHFNYLSGSHLQSQTIYHIHVSLIIIWLTYCTSSDWLVLYRSITYGTDRKCYRPALLHVYSHIINILLALFAWSIP